MKKTLNDLIQHQRHGKTEISDIVQSTLKDFAYLKNTPDVDVYVTPDMMDVRRQNARPLEARVTREKRDKLIKDTESENPEVRAAAEAELNRRPPRATGLLRDSGVERPLKPYKNHELSEAIHQGKDSTDPALLDLAKEASREALIRVENNPKTKNFFKDHAPDIFPALLVAGVSGGVVNEVLSEDEVKLSELGLASTDMDSLGRLLLLIAASALGVRGYKKFRKTKLGKQVQAKARSNPREIEPEVLASKRIDDVGKKAQNMYVSPTEMSKAWEGLQGMTRHLFQPLSRTLKKINPILTGIFRNHDGEIRTRTREYLDRATPFVVMMTKRFKKNPEKFREFKGNLLNGNYSQLVKMLGKNPAQKELDSLNDLRETLNDIRNYAREEGAIDVGYWENYFPRKVKDYPSFKKYLDENVDGRELGNQIDKALDEYAAKWNLPSRDLIPQDEAAEVVSRILRGYPSQSGASATSGHLNKQRTITNVTDDMLDAYADPADALKHYIERAVDSTERRKFLYGKPLGQGKQVGFEGSADRIGADLGMKMEVDGSLADTVARRLGKENKLTDEDIDKLRGVIAARFSGKTVSHLAQGLKNANYIQVMGNFGSAITQLAEISYAAFFHGFDNTFQALFNRKDNFNFTKHFGLSDHHIDAQTSAGALSKTLDKVFTGVGLKKLDQLSKNTIMNASWKKYRNEALNNSAELVDELSLFAGPERAREMVRALIDSKPNSRKLPKAVEELVWYKFLDLNPATLTEMPAGYTGSGNARILYMLKTFTLKQFDVYREAAGADISKANMLYEKGNKRGAARAAAEGVAKLAGLATLFAAANASTDVVKDTLYGRPTKPDDLLMNNVLRLFGINRYVTMKAQREGVAKASLELLLPPTAVFDRAWKDITDIVGDGEYKGNMLQGTPLDMIYWRALGGLDKIENMK